MAKKKRQKKQALKKTICSALIALLVLIISQLSEELFKTTNETTRLPAKEAPLNFYANQLDDNLTALYCSAIENAQQSITFVIYALMDPQIINALNRKVEEGIQMYIVCDAKASPGISRKIPTATIIRRVGKGLMHQKILIIDKEQVILGSANMTTESLKTHGNLVVGFLHKPLAEALENKAKSMDDAGFTEKLPPIETMINHQPFEVWALPDNHQLAVERVISLIRSAKKVVRIAMFTWTRSDFTDELIAAKKRGIQVEAVVDKYAGKGASSEVVKRLKNAQIPIRFNTGKGLLHHKFLYIDEETLVNGSANWTDSAFKYNDDVFLVLRHLNLEQRDKMNALWEVLQKKSTQASVKERKAA
ncbi:MAG: phospholipase D-like domain-containing protein [Parachlamydia sp.]|nr:phospholipase D-like domain-containing protein [Parachlamydia sp.]